MDLVPIIPPTLPWSRRSIVAALAGTVLGLAALVLLGWWQDVPALKQILPGAITMKANTALGFGLCAASLWLITRPGAWARRAALITGTLAALLGLATLVEYATGMNLRIDEILFTDPDRTLNLFPPGRLAPITAVCFVLLAIATAARAWPTRASGLVGRLSAGCVLVAGLQTCVGYAVGFTYLFGSAFHSQMALVTAVGFVLLSTGHLIAWRDGLPDPVSRVTRPMILAVSVVPITVRWLCGLGLAHGLYDQNFAELFAMMGSTALLVGLILITGASLRASEMHCLRKARALRDRDEEFRALVGSIAQSVWYKDPEGRVDRASESWVAHTGQAPERMLGWGWLDCVHPDDRARTREGWRDAVARQCVYEVEYRLRLKSGTWRWTLARAVPLFTDGRALRGWIGLTFDIDARKRAEILQLEARGAAERALTEVRRANELKSAFLANMSHEIRTPLGAILGFAEVCAEAEDTSPELKGYLEIIRRNATNLTKLINEILDLSRIEAGHERVSLAPVNLIGLVHEVVSEISILAAQKNLTLTIGDAPVGLKTLRTDAHRIKQILTNVIANSIKFTDAGRITVEVTIDPGEAPVIRVSDTGIGIAAEHHGRIFENFTQVDATETRRHGGTGLGLTLSRKLARLLGGDLVLVDSTRDVGSTFAIRVADHRAPERSAPDQFQ